MKTIYQAVGESIRAKRLQLGLTLEDLSELSGLHASYIGQIERNSKKASLETVAALAGALGVPVRGLFSDASGANKFDFSGQLDALLRFSDARKRRIILDVVRRLSKGLRGLR